MYAQLIQGGTTPDGSAFLKALAAMAAITTGNRGPMSVWEVNARA